ncbi:uroporphyrinogen-III C-methyltransferase [Agrobacterium vitis]|uniref:uroporphyrinogen-III C-methyltransferase n=1 Tax=Agrobacterium vitis TaxID=373 RepID=A0ABD6GEI8_AGRVI|nr:uroporphyrinogen-III C-methyltransferase [Agrobacterium vitis]MUO77827.1 uroporphyrinogen-III C-methyltransferase [Agrobacterium vitis]MUO93345.1 uroporphyrinogen-III C-methyltransferase [Agrobacterium vitis]MUP04696.1 uroporphyrinogen-III C-methyltransferase [Agrobacterium vitis]MUZ80867.1 uroporphyrinogen-III C-methyltransferase [Agrobacterium vitis]MVA08948.1 uroporphyrinogen-III C-methyltransferase [Agrobacterium vitis]
MMQDVFKPLPPLQPGHVWLAGAGPGDPGLLTLLAVRGLSMADVIVHDALVDEACLAYANPGAVLEYAGKRGGKPSARQRDISLRLVELAKSGKRVLRLKGGDPFVFGRGGEEALTLVEHGVPFRIVPGITAGIGGLAYAGIPVTHREVNHAVTFLTGHDSSGAMPDGIDWKAVAKGSRVIVMYMAMKHMGHIAAQLMAAGRQPEEPLAFVCDAATDRQRVLETTLGEADAAMQAAGIQPPAIVVLGDVVRLRPSLDWLGALSGRPLQPAPFANRSLKDTA